MYAPTFIPLHYLAIVVRREIGDVKLLTIIKTNKNNTEKKSTI